MAQSILGQLREALGSRRAIKIGVVTSRVGPLDYYGTMEIQGLRLGIEYATDGSWEVAGRPLQIFIEDDAGDPATGGQKARMLIEQEGVHILQGCASSAVAMVLAGIAEEYGRLFLIEPAAADSLTGPYLNRYLFRTAPNVSQDAATAGAYAVENLGRSFCFIAPDYIWGRQSTAAWKRVIGEHGGEILSEVLVPADETDFRPYLRQVLAAKAEVLVQSWAGAGSGPLFAQMREMGVFDVMQVTGGLGDREARHALGEAACGMVGIIKYSCILPTNQVNDWLVRHHQEQYGQDPDLFTGGGFAAGIALVEALNRTEGNPDAEALIPVMENLSFEGPKGTYTFRRQDHQALQPMYIVEMVMHPEQSFCIPRLIREISAEESAPPLAVAR
jgi:branched-chain amino acid transport system substrate-binding protein